jgi:ATP-dependent RNA/DNA helicase IGHMBP2
LSLLKSSKVVTDNVSIISPYLHQTELIREALNDNTSDTIEISTVDSFQGRENDLIIISLVRSNADGIVGFLSDYRRLNVAVTRARKQVFIIGDSETICHDKFLNSLYEYAGDYGLVISAQSMVGESDVVLGNTRGIYRPPSQKKTKKKPNLPAHAPSHPPTILSDTPRVTFESQIEAIPETEKYIFPASLTAADRRFIHEFCEKAGYLHGSIGEGIERKIWVQKKILSQVTILTDLVAKDEIMIASSPVLVKPKPMNKKSVSQLRKPERVIERISPPTNVVSTKAGICPFNTCQMSTKLVSLDCRHCCKTFCIAHATPECHGCGDAAKKFARSEAKARFNKQMGPPPIIQGKAGMASEQVRKRMDEKLNRMNAQRAISSSTKK